MSLINDMLKDLETRRAGKTVPEEESLKGLKSVEYSQDKQRKSKRWFVIILLIILMIVGLSCFVLSKLQIRGADSVKGDQQVLPAERAVPKEAEQPMVTVLPESGLILLKTIKTTQTGSEVLLQLDLSQPVRYQLYVSDDHQTLMLTLAHTRLSEPLPAIHNAIIEDSHLIEIDDHLLLTLEVVPDTEIKEIAMAEKEPFFLSMVLVNPKVVQVEDQQLSTVPVIKKTEVKPSPQQLAERSYEQALEAIDQNNFEQAEIELQASLKKVPNFIKARKTLVTLLINRQQYHSAAQLLQAGLRYTPDSVDLIKLYAQLLVRQGRLPKALVILQHVTPALEDEPEYYALMAVLRQRLGDPMIAAQLYEQLLKYNSNNSVWWMGLGIALESFGKRNAAVNAYKHAISTGGLSPDVQAYIEGKILQGS
jgi:tetratricopeptide (TPR) repeat protein